MKKLVCLLLVFCSLSVFAQNKNEIVTNHITTKKVYKYDYKDGNGEKKIKEQLTFDAKGNVIQETIYNSDGKIKKNVKYTYTNNRLTTEEYYKAGNKLSKKIVYKYNEKGLKTSKLEYDGSGKLLQKNEYVYEY